MTTATRMKGHDRFPQASTLVDGQWRRTRTVRCDICKYTSNLTEKPGCTLPDAMIGNKFKQRGWVITGPNAICPHCQQGKRPMAPAARRAAYCALAGVPRKSPHKAEPPPMPEVAPKPVPSVSAPAPVVHKAAPPIPATPGERRRIREALDLHYDEDAGRYRQSFSDKSLAAKLDVPAKWVTELREANGYGPDICEADKAKADAVEALRVDLLAIQPDILTLLQRFDGLEARVRKLSAESPL